MGTNFDFGLRRQETVKEKFCTGFSRTCTPQFIRFTVCPSVCLSGHLNSKFAMIEGFWVQFLQKSK